MPTRTHSCAAPDSRTSTVPGSFSTSFQTVLLSYTIVTKDYHTQEHDARPNYSAFGWRLFRRLDPIADCVRSVGIDPFLCTLSGFEWCACR